MTNEIKHQISIKEYFLDVFNSFNFDKNKIHEQLKRDLTRMIININGVEMKSIEQFYKLINKSDLPLIYKRIIWVLPTQVSMVYFYFYLQNYYLKKKNTYAVAELGNSNRYSNDFIINVQILNSEFIDIQFIKNFRVLDTAISTVPSIYNIFLEADIKIGRSKMINFKWKEITS
jgi:hypothetical protein